MQKHSKLSFSCLAAIVMSVIIIAFANAGNLLQNLTTGFDQSAAEKAYESGDFQTAFREFLRAAENGDSFSRFMAANMYAQGEGTAEDYQAAVYWFRQSAAQGYAPAHYSIGILELLGEGTAPDPVSAAAHFKAAAENEHAPSMYSLGLLYTYGVGVNEGPGGVGGGWLRATDKANGYSVDPLLFNDPDAALEKYIASIMPQPETVSARNQVRLIQERLEFEGYDPGPLDGLMGKKTAATIKAIQKDYGLKPTGRIDYSLLYIFSLLDLSRE